MVAFAISCGLAFASESGDLDNASYDDVYDPPRVPPPPGLPPEHPPPPQPPGELCSNACATANNGVCEDEASPVTCGRRSYHIVAMSPYMC